MSVLHGFPEDTFQIYPSNQTNIHTLNLHVSLVIIAEQNNSINFSFEKYNDILILLKIDNRWQHQTL